MRVQRPVRDSRVDRRRLRGFREIAHPPQQPPGDPRRAPRAFRHLARPVGGHVERQQARGAAHHLLQFRHAVEIEPHRDAETVAQRRRDQPLGAWSRRPG
jgi:hypothetical protein